VLLPPSLGEEGLFVILLLFVLLKLESPEPLALAAAAAAMAAARRPVRDVVPLLWEEADDSGSPPFLLLAEPPPALLIMGVSSLDVLRELSIMIDYLLSTIFTQSADTLLVEGLFESSFVCESRWDEELRHVSPDIVPTKKAKGMDFFNQSSSVIVIVSRFFSANIQKFKSIEE
jgi:hypothetical protein